MAEELKRVFVENPESPGAGVYFTGDNAEAEAEAYRSQNVVASTAADTETKAAAKAEDKAVKKD